jgi:phosphoribosylformylglycinamidine synthase
MLTAKVYVSLKGGVADPQGRAVNASLHALGFPEVEDVRVGRYLEARRRVEEMCAALLANPVIEDYRITVEETPS